MTTKIQDIINDPEYHWLLSQGKITPDVVRDSYFRSVVSQDPDFQGLNPLEQRRVRAAIMALPDPPSEPLLQQYRTSHPTGIQRVMGAVTPGKTAEDFAKQAAGGEKSAKVAEGIRAGVKAGATTGLGPFFGRRGGEIAGQVTLGAVDEALLGLPKAALEGAYGEGAFPQPETGAEAVASGLGRLGGFFAGPVGAVKLGTKALGKVPAAAKVASKFAPKAVDTTRAAEIGKYVAREAATLSAAITAARTGDILAQRTLEDSAKEALDAAAQGALMGGAFGATKVLIPGTTPAQTLARIGVINAAFQGKDVKDYLSGDLELNPDRIAQEAFETLVNSAFVIKGQRFPKEFKKAGEKPTEKPAIPAPAAEAIPETRPLQTQMIMGERPAPLAKPTEAPRIEDPLIADAGGWGEDPVNVADALAKYLRKTGRDETAVRIEAIGEKVAGGDWEEGVAKIRKAAMEAEVAPAGWKKPWPEPDTWGGFLRAEGYQTGALPTPLRKVESKLYKTKYGALEALKTMPAQTEPGMPSLELRKVPNGWRIISKGVYSFPGPVKEIVEGLGEAWTAQASRLIPVLNKSKHWRMVKGAFDPFANVPEANKLKILRWRTEGKLGKSEDIVQKVTKAFDKLDEAEQKVAYGYMTSRAGDLSRTPEEVAAHSVVSDPKYSAKYKEVRESKRLIDKMALAAKERGILPEESYKKYVGQYLPRVLLKYLLEGEGTGMGAAKKMPMDRWRSRNEEMTEEQKFALGEIKDPGFLAARAIGEELRSIHLHDFLKALHDEGVVTPLGPGRGPGWVDRSYVVKFKDKLYSRKAFSEFLDEQHKMLRLRPESEKAEAMKLIDEMEQALGPEPKAYDHKLYKELPDTKAYGPLRGMIVRKEIADDLTNTFNFVHDPTLFEKFWEFVKSSTRLFKMSKVVLNPPGQVRNAVANSMNLYIDGIDYDRQIQLGLKAIDQQHNKGTIWNLSRALGVKEGTFSAQEVRQLRTSFLSKQGRRHPLWKVKNAYGKLTDPSARTYQAVEAHFKLIKILDVVERAETAKGSKLTTTELHKAVEEGVLGANNVIFDYSLVPRSIRQIRNQPFGSLFITFLYKEIPFLAEASLKRPWRVLLPTLVISKGLEYATKLYHDLSDDDYKTLIASMTKYMKEQNSVYLLPFRNKDGSWRFMNFGYFFPWTPVQEVAEALIKMDPRQLSRELGVLRGPIPQLIQAFETGTDSFFGVKIWDEYDPPSQKFLKSLAYAWNMAMPPFMSTYGTTGRVVKAMRGQGDPRQGLGPDMGGALATLFGANTYRIAPEAQQDLYMSQIEYEIQKIEQELSRAEDEGNDRKAEYLEGKIDELEDELDETAARNITPAIRER